MPAKTTHQLEDVNNPYGYSDMDWAAQPASSRASSAGESRPSTARLPPHTAPAGPRRPAVTVPDTWRPESGRPAGHVSVGGFRLPCTPGSCAPARFLAVCLSASCGHLRAVAQPSEVGR